MSKLRKLFEICVKSKFPSADFKLILKWDKDTGYHNKDTNYMWIGFSAHYAILVAKKRLAKTARKW